MHSKHFEVDYNELKKELVVHDAWNAKLYDKICTVGDIGTAVKDFCMEIEEKGSVA